ncbi:MAG: ABC transporter permease subunit [Roseiflexaceae bacterium]
MEAHRTRGDDFAQLLRAEWAQFRTASGCVIGMMIVVLVTMLPGQLIAAGSVCQGPNGEVCPAIPVGPDGEAVADKFFFVHQPLAGDGSVTIRLTSLTGLITYPPPNHDQIVPGVVPWAKAGVIIKASTKQGSAYAAMMLTGSQGVRMQYNFIEDIAGRPGSASAESPRWLRLTRSGGTLTGYESTDGTQWTRVGTADLAGLPATVQVGFFVTSPCDLTVSEGACRFANATAIFDQVSLQGQAPDGAWSSDELGVESGLPDHLYGRVEESSGTFTVTGSGDIAPLGAEGGWPIERALIGTLAGLIAVIVVAVLFVSAEHRPSLIHTTQLTRPRLDQVLVAKAIVIGTVTFVAGLATVIIAVQLGKQIQRNYILPVTPLTELRVTLGTAALLAVAAVFALALGAIFRRRVAAMSAGIAIVVVPYMLAVANILPLGASHWLLRLTPAAAFAIQQSTPEYRQVIGLYLPLAGYYPLAPWAGFTVLCAYTALALSLAVFLLRRRDA